MKKKIMILLILILLLSSLMSIAYAFTSGTAGGSSVVSGKGYKGFTYYNKNATGTRYAIRIDGKDVGGNDKYEYWVTHYQDPYDYYKVGLSGQTGYDLFDVNPDSNPNNNYLYDPAQGKYRVVTRWNRASGAIDATMFALNENNVNRLIDLVTERAQQTGNQSVLDSINKYKKGQAKMDIRAEMVYTKFTVTGTYKNVHIVIKDQPYMQNIDFTAQVNKAITLNAPISYREGLEIKRQFDAGINYRWYGNNILGSYMKESAQLLWEDDKEYIEEIYGAGTSVTRIEQGWDYVDFVNPYEVKCSIEYRLIKDENTDLSKSKLITIEDETFLNPRPVNFGTKTEKAYSSKYPYQFGLSNLELITFKLDDQDPSANLVERNDSNPNIVKVTIKNDNENHKLVFYYKDNARIKVKGAYIKPNGDVVIKKDCFVNKSYNTWPVDKQFDGNSYEWEGYDFDHKYIELNDTLTYVGHDLTNVVDGDIVNVHMEETDDLREKYILFLFKPKTYVTVNHIFVDKDGNETNFYSDADLPISEPFAFYSRNTNSIRINGKLISDCVNANLIVKLNGQEIDSMVPPEDEIYSYTLTPEEGGNYEINFYYTQKRITPEVDSEMEIITTPNQYITDNKDEKIWVLDHTGQIKIKMSYTSQSVISGNAGITFKFPFDVYVNNKIFKAGDPIENKDIKLEKEKIQTVDEMDIREGIFSIVVPMWVTEGDYEITATSSYQSDSNMAETNETITNESKGKVKIVGQIYDFSITNLHDGDRIWKSSLFTQSESLASNGEYETSALPIGQGNNQQNKAYNYGIMKGTKFYFSVNTIGSTNGYIAIKPTFYYIPKAGGTLTKVDLYQNGNKIPDTIARLTSVTDANRITAEYTKERSEGLKIPVYASAYANNVTNDIGTYNSIKIGSALRTPYVNFVAEGNIPEYRQGKTWSDLASASGVQITDLYQKASHWYGDYTIPNNVTYKDEKGTEMDKDGDLVVYFSIVSLKSDGKTEYLAYNLLSPDGDGSKTQWQVEGASTKYVLPRVEVNQTAGAEVGSWINGTGKNGAVPVAVYGNVSTKQNYESTGTH